MTVEAVFRDGAGHIKCGVTGVYAKDMPDTPPSVYGDRPATGLLWMSTLQKLNHPISEL